MEMAEGARRSRSWAEMAPDTLAHIFRRIPLWQLLTIIPCVCKPWKRASLNPLCYQTLHLLHLHPIFQDFFWVRDEDSSTGYPLTQLLLARSQGCLLEITYPPFVDGLRGLYLIACSAPLLQKLHIPKSLADDKWATYAAPLMPHIVDLDLSMCGEKLSHEAIKAFGRSCKHMRCLRINRSLDYPSSDDSEAVAIAQYYPCLEHLELQCNPLSNEGLQAILDSCPSLQYLDLRGCENLQSDMDISLFLKCQAQVKVFINDFEEDSDYYDNYDASYVDQYLDFWCNDKSNEPSDSNEAVVNYKSLSNL